MQGAAGATEQAFADFSQGINGVGFSLEQSRAHLEVFSQKIGQSVLDAFEPFIKGLNGSTGALACMDEATLKNIVSIGQIVAGVSAGVMVFGLATKAQIAYKGSLIGTTLATQGATGAVKLFNTALKANPMGAAAGAAIMLATALGTLIGRLNEAKRVAEEQKEATKASAQALLNEDDAVLQLIGELKAVEALKDKSKEALARELELKEKLQATGSALSEEEKQNANNALGYEEKRRASIQQTMDQISEQIKREEKALKKQQDITAKRGTQSETDKKKYKAK